MKTIKIGSWIFALIIPVTLMGQGKFIPEDDLYYKRGEENPIVQQKQKEKPKANTLVVTGAKKIVITSGERNVDEYNRRGNPIGREEAYNDSIPPRDSVVMNEEEGEYINGFNGSQSDFEYAERIRRFHNPRFTIHISDPAYTEIYFLNNNDWNVYTDGSYAWVTPTWTNRYYWDYMWTPYSYRPYWQFGWYGSSWSMGWGSGWYDPWYYGGYYPYYGYGNWGYPYGYYGGYPYGYYGGYYGGYHHNWGYSNPGYTRYDNGRRPTTDAYGSRSSRYGGRSNNVTTRSTDSYENSNYNRGRSGRYTTVPSTRSGSDSYYSTGTRSGGRSDRYSQPGSNENNVRSTGGQSRENTYRNGSGTSGGRGTRYYNEDSYTPSSGSRTNYSTGSSDNPGTTRSSGYSGGRSSSYSSGSNETRSSSYSTPSSGSSSGSYNSGRSSSSGSNSSGSSSSGSSSGGGRSSSGGGGGRR